MKKVIYAIISFFLFGALEAQTIHKSLGIEGLYVNSIVNTVNYKARVNLFNGDESAIGVQTSPGIGVETPMGDYSAQPAYSLPLAMEYIYGLTSDDTNLSMKGWGTRVMLLTTNGGVNPGEELDLTPTFNAGLGLSYIFQNERLQTAAIDINGFVPLENEEGIVYDWGVSIGVRYMLGIY